METLYEVHHSVGADEKRFYLMAMDEPNCREHLKAEEAAGGIEPGWTIFDLGSIEMTSRASGPTQLTKDPSQDGVWLETA